MQPAGTDKKRRFSNYDTILDRAMPVNRSKDAWIWVAVAAITLASLARAQSGIENARAYAAPVIKFLSGSALADPGASAANHRSGESAQSGAFTGAFNLLPVFFIGLLFCYSLTPSALRSSPVRALCAPCQPKLFQRPPPCSLA